MPEAGVMRMAEDLIPRLRVADWLDRAEAAQRQLEHLDLRDLRSVVASADDPLVAATNRRGRSPSSSRRRWPPSRRRSSRCGSPTSRPRWMSVEWSGRSGCRRCLRRRACRSRARSLPASPRRRPQPCSRPTAPTGGVPCSRRPPSLRSGRSSPRRPRPSSATTSCSRRCGGWPRCSRRSSRCTGWKCRPARPFPSHCGRRHAGVSPHGVHPATGRAAATGPSRRAVRTRPLAPLQPRKRPRPSRPRRPPSPRPTEPASTEPPSDVEPASEAEPVSEVEPVTTEAAPPGNEELASAAEPDAGRGDRVRRRGARPCATRPAGRRPRLIAAGWFVRCRPDSLRSALMSDVVLYEPTGRVAVITLNRPEARNAVNGALATGLESAIDQLEEDDELWVGIFAPTPRARNGRCSRRSRPEGDQRRQRRRAGHGAGWVRRVRLPGAAQAGDRGRRRTRHRRRL